jgi:hypothetical protein
MASKDLHVAFWQWFYDNIDRFVHFDDDMQRLMHELSNQLHQIDENLTYEISSAQSGSRELVISADGIEDSFPSVIELTNAAPEVPGWTITAFRRRIDVTQFTLQYNSRDFSAKDVYFWLQSEGRDIDLILYIPSLTDDNRNELVSVCFLLLDMAIGEYNVTKNIRHIDHQPLPPNPQSEGLKPLTELPKQFDELYAKVHIGRE